MTEPLRLVDWKAEQTRWWDSGLNPLSHHSELLLLDLRRVLINAGFAFKIGPKILMTLRQYNKTCIMELNNIYMQNYGLFDRPFELL